MSLTQEMLQRAWQAIWNRLYHSKTSLFYDYASSFDHERRFDHLPTPAEIALQYPNTNGWGTGMEDSAITGGVMLAAVCDRFAATGEEFLRGQAADIFRGLESCAATARTRGLVLRSISPRDGTSHYIETSRDQLTHFAHGCWRFFQSPLADDAQRSSMRRMMTALSVLLERRMKPEFGYHLGKENGEPGIYDVMWDVAPHEVGRLPMIYGITWQLTGDSRWYELYRRYAEPAAEQAAELHPESCPVYGLFQHQVSMEVLFALAEDEPELRSAWKRLMHNLADYAATLVGQLPRPRPVEISAIDLDWRTWPRWQGDNSHGYEVPVMPARVTADELRPLREAGEALLIQLMCPDRPPGADQRDFLEGILIETDFSRRFTYGMIYPQAAWWRARRNLRQAQAVKPETQKE